MNDRIKSNTPLIFIVMGEIIKHFKWFGFAAIALIIAGGAYYFYVEYNRILEDGISRVFSDLLFLATCSFLSLGFVKFAEKYGEAMREGKRSAIIGIILVAGLVSAITAVLVVINRDSGDETAFQITLWFLLVLLTLIFTLSSSLIVYWKDLKGGLEIYEK